ncbi:MAG: hypothetical protein WAN36_14230, partial [Calditrichia bacterium]
MLKVMPFLLTISLVWGQSPPPLSEWQEFLVLDGGHTPGGLFQDAVAIDLDSEGNLFAVDRGRHRIIKYNANQNFVREIGGFGSSGDQFSSPSDIDAHLTLNIFVSDFNNNRI